MTGREWKLMHECLHSVETGQLRELYLGCNKLCNLEWEGLIAKFPLLNILGTFSVVFA